MSGINKINKSVLVILGLGAIIILIVFVQYSRLGTTEISTPAPSIEVSPKSWDFGNITYLGGEVKKVFTVENTGELPLEINWVSTSCGCTRAYFEKKDMAYFEKKDIPSGERANLTVTLDPSLMGRGMNISGQILKVVYIRSNDPVNPEVEVEISANIVK